MFVSADTKPGSSIHWNETSQTREIREYTIERGHTYHDGIEFHEIPHCTFGDYDNSTQVERSNHRVMRRDFPWLVHVYGSHGSEMLGYLGKRENQNPALIEAIDALEAYPIADESDLSELESNARQEAWQDFGCRDFADWLVTDHEGIPNYGIPAGVPLALICNYESNTQAFEHPLTSWNPTVREVSEAEMQARKALDDIWYLVHADGSGETCGHEGGGGIYFRYDDWYRTIWRNVQRRADCVAELEHARATHASVLKLEAEIASGDKHARDVLLDVLTDCGLDKAASHVRYADHGLGEALDKLDKLSTTWEMA